MTEILMEREGGVPQGAGTPPLGLDEAPAGIATQPSNGDFGSTLAHYR